MRHFSRLLLLLATLLLPTLAMAAAPAPVSGLVAARENGGVHVRWNASADAATVAYYHVYYSRASILQNAGAYDDFETAGGKQTDLLLTHLPTGATSLFVAVLPVGSDGQEAATFTNEVQVDLSDSAAVIPPAASAAASSAVAAPAVPAAASASTPAATAAFQLLSVQAISSTGVLLTFSLPVQLDAAHAPEAFMIHDASGASLVLTRLHISGTQVQIDTRPQSSGIVYIVQVAPVLTGLGTLGPSAFQVPLQTFTFIGIGDGSALTAPPLPAPAPQAPVAIPAPAPAAPTADIVNVRLQAEPQPNGLYIVTATWDVTGDPAAIASVHIRQTGDDGKSYGAQQDVSGSARVLRFHSVGSGQFGVLLQPLLQDGSTSAGALASITLQSLAPSPSATLPRSGPGLLLALVLSSAAIGWLWMRRRALA